MQNISFTIARLDAFPLRVPFHNFVTGARSSPASWREFDMVLVRAETTDGVVGWGECFAYSCLRPVWAAAQDMVFPLALNRKVTSIIDLNVELQFKLHIFGRYGITMFAISGLDIALWDIAAKISKQSLADFIGGDRRDSVPAYASLVRYDDSTLTSKVAARAVDEGYRYIKLHEIAYDPIATARHAIGTDIKLMMDVNCSWNLAQAEEFLPKLKALELHWVEEPVFPPEDFATLKKLQRFGIELSAGENACTAMEFVRLMDVVTFLQPSVIKVGGVSEFLKIVQNAKVGSKIVMPHSPYFGPGYWATLQLATLLPDSSLFEFMYVKPEVWLDPSIPLPQAGRFVVPKTLGLGFSPDPGLIKRFRVY